MASEYSLLQKWQPAYQPSASGIPLKMARHPAYQKGVSHPLNYQTVCVYVLSRKISSSLYSGFGIVNYNLFNLIIYNMIVIFKSTHVY